MARTAIDASAIHAIGNQKLGVGAGELALTFDALDDVNGNELQATGAEVLIFRNTDVGAQTVTLTAAPDSYGRTGSIATYSIPAAGIIRTEILTEELWEQTDGMIYIDASDAAVEVAVLRIND